jgi:hypothetical protein
MRMEAETASTKKVRPIKKKKKRKNEFGRDHTNTQQEKGVDTA